MREYEVDLIGLMLLSPSCVLGSAVALGFVEVFRPLFFFWLPLLLFHFPSFMRAGVVPARAPLPGVALFVAGCHTLLSCMWASQTRGRGTTLQLLHCHQLVTVAVCAQALQQRKIRGLVQHFA